MTNSTKGRDWRHCDLHPDVNPDTMWGCPDCVALARHEIAALKQQLAAMTRERDEAVAKCEMALSRNQELIDERDEAFSAGVRAVLTIRCSRHTEVPPLSATEFSGGECGACVQEAAQMQDSALAELAREMRGFTEQVWEAYANGVAVDFYDQARDLTERYDGLVAGAETP